MKKAVLSVGLILAFFLWASAQEPSQNPPKDLQESVDKLFARWDKPDSPGCVLAIIKDGHILYKRAYGMADLERGVALTTNSVFDVGSISKQFTAMSIALSTGGTLPPIPGHGPRMSAVSQGHPLPPDIARLRGRLKTRYTG